jgi:hypothetical protein
MHAVLLTPRASLFSLADSPAMSTPGKKGKAKQPAQAAPAPAAKVDDEKDEGVAAAGEVAEEKANDAATGLTASDAPVDEDGNPIELVRYGFDILANIKQAQLQNGLRHGDYQRYRQES